MVILKINSCSQGLSDLQDMCESRENLNMFNHKSWSNIFLLSRYINFCFENLNMTIIIRKSFPRIWSAIIEKSPNYIFPLLLFLYIFPIFHPTSISFVILYNYMVMGLLLVVFLLFLYVEFSYVGPSMLFSLIRITCPNNIDSLFWISFLSSSPCSNVIMVFLIRTSFFRLKLL